jgi:hypothetical protein
VCKLFDFVPRVESAFTELVARKGDEPEEEMRDDEPDQAEDDHPDAFRVAHRENVRVRRGMVRVHPPDLREYPEDRVDDGEEHMAGADREAREEELDEQARVAQTVARVAVNVAGPCILEPPVEDGDQGLQHHRELEEEDLNRGQPSPETRQRLVFRVDADAVGGVHRGHRVVRRHCHNPPVREEHGRNDGVRSPGAGPAVDNSHANEVERQHKAPHEQHLAPPGLVRGRERRLHGPELEYLQRLRGFPPEEEPEHRPPRRRVIFRVHRRRLPLRMLPHLSSHHKPMLSQILTQIAIKPEGIHLTAQNFNASRAGFNLQQLGAQILEL